MSNIRNVIIILSILSCNIVYSQKWERAKVRTNVTCVAFNPLNGNTIFATSTLGFFHRSYDGGTTWDTLSLPYIFPQTITVSPTDTNIIISFPANFHSSALRSIDQGRTWLPMTLPMLSHSQQTRYRVNSESVMYDVVLPNTLYAGLIVDNDSSGFSSHRVETWFCKSTDNGNTWDTVCNFKRDYLLPWLCGAAIHPFLQHFFQAGAGGCILRSVNKGKTWEYVHQPWLPFGRTEGKGPGIKFSKRTGNALLTGFATNIVDLNHPGGSGGILRTTNTGDTWEQIAFPDTSFWGLEVIDVPPKTIVIAGGYNINGRFPNVQISYDLGDTWQRLDDSTTPWLRKELTDVRSIKYNPNKPHGREYFFATEGGLLMYTPPTTNDVSDDGMIYKHTTTLTAKQFIIELLQNTDMENLTIHSLNGELLLNTTDITQSWVSIQKIVNSVGVYACSITLSNHTIHRRLVWSE